MMWTEAEAIPASPEPKAAGLGSRMVQKLPHATSSDSLAKEQVRLRQFIPFSLIFPFSLISQTSQEVFEAVQIRAGAAAFGLDPHKLHPSFTQPEMFCWTIDADTGGSLSPFSPSPKLEHIQVFKGWTSFSQCASSRASLRQTFSLLGLMSLEDFRNMIPAHFSNVLQI